MLILQILENHYTLNQRKSGNFVWEQLLMFAILMEHAAQFKMAGPIYCISIMFHCSSTAHQKQKTLKCNVQTM